MEFKHFNKSGKRAQFYVTASEDEYYVLEMTLNNKFEVNSNPRHKMKISHDSSFESSFYSCSNLLEL